MRQDNVQVVPIQYGTFRRCPACEKAFGTEAWQYGKVECPNCNVRLLIPNGGKTSVDKEVAK